MRMNMRRFIVLASCLAVLCFVLIMLNQVLQLASSIAHFNEHAGKAVLYLGISVLLASIIAPIYIFIRLPRPLVVPSQRTGPVYDKYLKYISRRLTGNPLLLGAKVDTESEIEAALKVLDGKATELIKKAGSRAFIATSISQNGALDALVVLGIQSRMIWDIMKIYQQRPTAADMVSLYANVFATSFVAAQLDDADVSGVVHPVMTAALGSAAGLIPGLQVATSVFVNSVLTGTANAFLTLRVGVIAREYQRSLVRQERGMLRKLAFVQAGNMLGAIAASGAVYVAKTIGRVVIPKPSWVGWPLSKPGQNPEKV